MARRSLKEDAYKGPRTHAGREPDTRSFFRFYHGLIAPRLLSAAQAYTYIEPPPCIRVSEDVPGDWLRLSHSNIMGQYIERRVGTPWQRQLAMRARQVDDEMLGATQRRIISAPHSKAIFRVPHRRPSGDGPAVSWVMLNADSFVPVDQRVMYFNGDCGAFLFRNPGGEDVEFTGVEGGGEHASAECSMWTDWVQRFHVRRRQAWMVCCFMGMLGANQEASVRTIFRTFPWMPGFLTAMRIPKDAVMEATLPWRGHDGAFIDYMLPVEPPRRGEAWFAWEREEILKLIRKLGEESISALAARMVTANMAYPQQAPTVPSNLLNVTLPRLVVPDHESDPDGSKGMTRFDTAPAWPTPYWMERYIYALAGSVAGGDAFAFGVNMLNSMQKARILTYS